MEITPIRSVDTQTVRKKAPINPNESSSFFDDDSEHIRNRLQFSGFMNVSFLDLCAKENIKSTEALCAAHDRGCLHTRRLLMYFNLVPVCSLY